MLAGLGQPKKYIRRVSDFGAQLPLSEITVPAQDIRQLKKRELDLFLADRGMRVRIRRYAELRALRTGGFLEWRDLLHEAYALALEKPHAWTQGDDALPKFLMIIKGLSSGHGPTRMRRSSTDEDFEIEAVPDQSQSNDEQAHVSLASLRALAVCTDGWLVNDDVAAKVFSYRLRGLKGKEVWKALAVTQLAYESALTQIRRAILRCKRDKQQVVKT